MLKFSTLVNRNLFDFDKFCCSFRVSKLFQDYLDAALITVMQIHLTEPPGDILLFLTGNLFLADVIFLFDILLIS